MEKEKNVFQREVPVIPGLIIKGLMLMIIMPLILAFLSVFLVSVFIPTPSLGEDPLGFGGMLLGVSLFALFFIIFLVVGIYVFKKNSRN